MIFDWDLWPWMVNEQAGGQTGVHLYRLQRGIERMARTIGEALLPAFSQLNQTMARAAAAFIHLDTRI